jgi:acyl carrier protein
MIEINDFITEIKVHFEDSDAAILEPDTIFKQLDSWDSLTKYSIIAFLQDEYNFQFSIDDFDKYTTPKAIYDFINI